MGIESLSHRGIERLGDFRILNFEIEIGWWWWLAFLVPPSLDSGLVYVRSLIGGLSRGILGLRVLTEGTEIWHGDLREEELRDIFFVRGLAIYFARVKGRAYWVFSHLSLRRPPPGASGFFSMEMVN